MTKLIIQIPCLNEAEVLPETLAKLPRSLPGIDIIEYLIIDDGSTDDTSGIARRWGVHHIVRHRRNRGLAEAFRNGVEKCLAEGADIIVNTDADGQYAGEDIATIVAPVVAGEADIVIGDRSVAENAHFSPFKRALQRLGSYVVRTLSSTDITDAVSGFRAMTRDAVQRINITTEFSYTTDMLIQAGRKRLAIKSVPIRTNSATRPSRLFKSIPRFIMSQGMTITRAYTTFNALRVFTLLGAALTLVGLLPMARFVWFFVNGQGDGHIQSLVIGGALLTVGVLVATLGILADLIATNRKLMEASILKLRRMDEKLEAIEKAQKETEVSLEGIETAPERRKAF
ncbi:glycosyltransferase family 2 protein [Erythrobacter crassostreae]|uniref:Glycosyltransferase family 2 protein n=1 Tax=Erythrobacter crassostreae TaxID=2828328 RepID=A0A9X1JKZ4_9SPHN|nr:glycosyltransferase family 2 protein [Erythrobacter crassostrea]MBV7259481.1 glycosyltransferase family 2 protein [Erythrobacter crassostrea]